ncbi:MAG: oligopeptidase [Microbacteriaceae bacterium]|nr:oligopeptidase [Microbacteriaceae bacterium]
MPVEPPVAPRIPVKRSHHGDTVVDDYEWMREKTDPAVLAHLEAENAYTDDQTAHLAPLRATLFDEIKNRTRETDLSVPVREGAWWYYTRTVEGKQYGIHCRAPLAAASDWTPPVLPGDQAALPGEQVLLDDNFEAANHDFYSLGSFDVTGDGTKLLFAVDSEGDERYRLRIRNLETGETLPDAIENTAGGATFDASGRFVFYTTVDDAWRPDTVWRHEVGTPSTDDVSVFHEPDERYWVAVGLTRSRRYLEIAVGSSVTSEAMLIDASDPTGEPTIVWPRREGIEYSVEHAVIDGQDRLLITHNDGAVDFEVTDVAADDPQGERRTLVPHRPGTRIESVDAFAGHLVLEYRREALPRIAVLRLENGTPRAAEFTEIPFAETLFAVGAGGNPEWTQPVVRLHYGSFVTPATVSDYDVATGELHLLKQKEVLGGYDPTIYVQRREWAIADDGTRVPISLVYRGDRVAQGEAAPALLYGYGSYEHSIDPGFAISRLSLLDRGVVFAVAHVRGGGELGRHWYEQGKTLSKVNTFTDFVACARHLVEIGVTSPDRLVAEGASAGGLLMGAVANIAPESFAGILAVVPFVDPLTSILDPSLPLTVIEWDEWGNPLDDAEVYRLMKSYSPYENVRPVTYPRILAVTSINDTRVLYVEPAKWVARLREIEASVLLRTEMNAGHGGASGRYEAWHKRAFELAWVLDVLGLSAD